MTTKDYLGLVGKLMEKAEENKDREELIRLAKAVIDTFAEKIEQLSKIGG